MTSALRSTPAEVGPRLRTDAVIHETTATAALGEHDILHLAELVPVLRQRLELGHALSDDVILTSLETIAARSSPRERWRAAFDSSLGHWMAHEGRDLNTALNTLVALLPKPRM